MNLNNNVNAPTNYNVGVYGVNSKANNGQGVGGSPSSDYFTGTSGLGQVAKEHTYMNEDIVSYREGRLGGKKEWIEGLLEWAEAMGLNINNADDREIMMQENAKWASIDTAFDHESGARFFQFTSKEGYKKIQVNPRDRGIYERFMTQQEREEEEKRLMVLFDKNYIESGNFLPDDEGEENEEDKGVKVKISDALLKEIFVE